MSQERKRTLPRSLGGGPDDDEFLCPRCYEEKVERIEEQKRAFLASEAFNEFKQTLQFLLFLAEHGSPVEIEEHGRRSVQKAEQPARVINLNM
jgi:hypothetical protein